MKAIKLIVLFLCITALSDAQTVYITKTGSKYHSAGCRYLSRSQIPISLEKAIKRYGPCSVCRPPTSVRPTQKVQPSSTPVETKSSPSRSPASSAATSLTKSTPRVGHITSVVDGTNIFEVNIWDHRTRRTNVVCSCRDKEQITVLEEDDTYVKIRTKNGDEGWCMKLFLTE